MDKFDAMRAFVRIVETGSFTQAAHSLGMNRASLSQLVQQLEARLRVKLLNRTTRQVNVTGDGAMYYEHVVRLLGELEEVEANLPGASGKPHGRVRVDVPSPFATLILMPALPQFHAAYPQIQFDIGASDRKVDLIGENVDCVIRGGDITDQSLVARRIGELALGIYAAPAYLERHGIPQHPQELQGDAHRIVRFKWGRHGDALPYALHKDGHSVKFAGQHVVAIDDGNAYLAAGVAGLGILGLPDYMAKACLANGSLVRLFAHWESDRMPISVAYPPNRHLSHKVRVFIDWVSTLLQ